MRHEAKAGTVSRARPAFVFPATVNELAMLGKPVGLANMVKLRMDAAGWLYLLDTSDKPIEEVTDASGFVSAARCPAL